MLDAYDDVLTVDELCAVLKIGRNKAYQLMKSAEIGAFKCGNTWIIPKQAVIHFIKSNFESVLEHRAAIR